MLEEHDRPSNH
jgi:hypothetical protein